MGVILLALLLALLVGGLGFAAHTLWIIAVGVSVAWPAEFAVSGGELSGGRWARS